MNEIEKARCILHFGYEDQVSDKIWKIFHLS